MRQTRRTASSPTWIRIDPENRPPVVRSTDDDVPGVSIFWRRSQARSRWLSVRRGDVVEAENFYQHAEHYFRVMKEQNSK